MQMQLQAFVQEICADVLCNHGTRRGGPSRVTPVGEQNKSASLLSVAIPDPAAEGRCRRCVDPLGKLIWYWGMAYRLWAANGTWYARRNGRDEIMQAADPEQLSFMIRDDYFGRATSPAASPRPR
jgi:hypothetical protein